MTMKLVARIIWETFQWLALFGGLSGVLLGVVLIFNSGVVVRVGESMNKWVSTRGALDKLDTPIPVERTVYRYHRIVGVVLLAGALYALYVLVLRFKGPELVAIIARLLRLQLALGLAESIRVFLVLMNAGAAVVALTMLVRPSTLKGVESWANREYSTRGASRFLEVMRSGPDVLVQRHPQATGAVLAVAGAYIIGSLLLAKAL
jgi:hypothetical protein